MSQRSRGRGLLVYPAGILYVLARFSSCNVNVMSAPTHPLPKAHKLDKQGIIIHALHSHSVDQHLSFPGQRRLIYTASQKNWASFISTLTLANVGRFLKFFQCWNKKEMAHNKNKCKKHSLSHQLTALLHMENSKNKKMVITLLQHIA